MVIYGYLYLGLIILSLGINLGKDDGKAIVINIISFALILPLLGRVLGWW